MQKNRGVYTKQNAGRYTRRQIEHEGVCRPVRGRACKRKQIKRPFRGNL